MRKYSLLITGKIKHKPNNASKKVFYWHELLNRL